MGRPNVDVIVSGVKQAECTYKTIVLKGNFGFAEQVTEPNTKYVIKWDFDLKGQTVTIPEPKGTGTIGGMLDKTIDVGFCYFDTDLHKPIYASVIANNGTVTWVDATGAAV